MTLVAGFKCKDGFVLAADTAMTYGDIIFQGHKITNCFGSQTSYDIWIGGAGEGNYVDTASQAIRDSVRLLSNPTLTAIKTEVEKVISEIHENHIFKYWQPDDVNRPTVDLVIGVQDEQQIWGILRTSKSTVSEVEEHAVAGSGSILAEYLIERIWDRGQSTAVTVHLAQQLFREVKNKGINVGGNTEIVGRRVSQTAEEFFNISGPDYRFLWGMEELQLSAVRVALDISKPKPLLEKRIDEISKRLLKLREDSEKRRARGDTVWRIEFGTEYGSPLKDF
jgi:20S proteasome alpha/beta subunit